MKKEINEKKEKKMKKKTKPEIKDTTVFLYTAKQIRRPTKLSSHVFGSRVFHYSVYNVQFTNLPKSTTIFTNIVATFYTSQKDQ